MPFPRLVEPERLDELPADDPNAIRSRGDLQRLNGVMRHVGIVARRLERFAASHRPRLVVDLGAGDGTFLLRVARRLGPAWSGTTAMLVDRVTPASAVTRRALAEAGWQVEVAAVDALAGVAQVPQRGGTIVLANLFLHHLDREPLRELLAHVAARAAGLVACEPRRSRFALGVSRLVGLVGCNAVTRHDAVVSVRAGFAGREISELWPPGGAWSVEEGPAGPFSHVFSARLREAAVTA